MHQSVIQLVTHLVTPMSSLRNSLIAKMPTPAKGRRLLFDSHREAPGGFGLKLTEAGAKIFIFRYTFDGKQRLKTIGRFPSWKVEAARLEAQRLRVEIDSQIDPLEVKRRRRLEPLVRDVADEWTKRHASRLKSGREIARALTVNVLPHIGGLKIGDVTRTDIINALDELFETSPRAAEQTLSYVKQLFRFASDRGHIAADPSAGLRKSAFGQSNRAVGGRERVLDDAEIRSFWNSTPSAMDQLTHICLKLILLTGQRPGEVAGMRSDEIDGAIWTIPAQRRKTNQGHSITLPPTALGLIEEAREEVIRRQKRRGGGAAQFVFETRIGKPISTATLSQAVIRNHEDLKIKPPAWRPHDLRRTCRTRLSEIGIAPHIAEAVIGHQRRGVLGTYDRHAYSAEIKSALEQWEARLLEIISENVIAFPVKSKA